MNKKYRKVLLYAFFAIISILVNISTQFLFFQIYKGTFYIYFGMALGTMVGLPTKYFLDKKWIFYHKSDNLFHNFKTFIMYSIMGAITTTIFFIFELGFYYSFPNTDIAKYVGALIGLIITYIMKYFLDKKFVFK